MPNFLDSPKKAFRQLFAKPRSSTPDTVAARFLQVFQEHGVEATRIPRLLPQIRLDDLQSPAKLLAALTTELLHTTAQLFGVRRQWLEGIDDQIYGRLGTYKQPGILLEHLATAVADSKPQRGWPLRALVTTMHLDRNDDRSQAMVPILLERIAELDDETIYRYHLYVDGFDWSYAPGRMELKALARLAYQIFRTTVPLYPISQKQMSEIMACKAIPWRYLMGTVLTTPSLEDFALSKEESALAREVEELPEVLRYIEENKLQSFCVPRTDSHEAAKEAEPVEGAASPVPVEKKRAREPGKRQVQESHWDAIRAAADALWSQDGLLSIADMIRRLKRMPKLKASALSDSAIRKHVRGVAPEGVRGKPGRKPHQLP
jgi:hypothetical protein